MLGSGKGAEPWLIIVFALLGITLGVAGYWIAASREQEQVFQRFDVFLSDQASAITEEVLTYTETLYALASLYETHGDVTRQEFDSFTHGALSRHPAIQAFEWVPRIPASSRELHEKQAREEGFEDYRIIDYLSARTAVPAAQREEYYPVHYVAPYTENEFAVGFDLNSDPTRRQALLRAQTSGGLTFTDPIMLVQETGTSQGILGILPVYGESEEVALPRANNCQGFVLLVFRIEDILKNCQILNPKRTPALMHFNLIDEDAGGESVVMFSSLSEDENEIEKYGSWHKTIAVGGQNWLLTGYPTEAFISEFQSNEPIILGFTTFLAWGLLSGLLVTSSKRSSNRVLQEKDHMIRSVLCNLNEGVVVADNSGHFVLFNEAAENMVGMNAISSPPEEWTEQYGCFCPDTKTPFPADQLPLARAMRGETVKEVELFIRNPKVPSGIWLSINGAPLYDESNELQGGVITFRDITSHKKSSDVVRRLNNAVEHTTDTVFITDRNGSIEYVNPAFVATTGYTMEEAIGNTPRLLKSGLQDGNYYKELWATLLNGNVFRAMVVNRKKNGELYHADQTITPMKDASGSVTHFVSVLKDMTEERKRQEHEFEMALAHSVQEKLYPQEPPEVPGFDLAGAVFPTVATCGDYFDYIPMRNNTLAITIGDVSGHGLSAALIMAETRAYFRSLALTNSNLGEILTIANTALFSDLEVHRFVTLLLASIDTSTGHLVYASAGHVPGYILDQSGAVRETISSTGLPLGVIAESTYTSSQPISLYPGDLVVLLTDGVTEARNPKKQFISIEEILDVIRSCRHLPAQRILENVFNTVHDFACGEPQEDDITIVILKVNSLS